MQHVITQVLRDHCEIEDEEHTAMITQILVDNLQPYLRSPPTLLAIRCSSVYADLQNYGHIFDVVANHERAIVRYDKCNNRALELNGSVYTSVGSYPGFLQVSLFGDDFLLLELLSERPAQRNIP